MLHRPRLAEILELVRQPVHVADYLRQQAATDSVLQPGGGDFNILRRYLYLGEFLDRGFFFPAALIKICSELNSSKEICSSSVNKGQKEKTATKNYKS